MSAENPYPEAETTRAGVVADHRHVSPDEAKEASSSNVGDGTPKSAPDFEYSIDVPEATGNPTNKWVVARITAVSGWLVAFVEAGYVVDTTLAILGVTILTEGLTAWITKNAGTPGGVPVKFSD